MSRLTTTTAVVVIISMWALPAAPAEGATQIVQAQQAAPALLAPDAIITPFLHEGEKSVKPHIIFVAGVPGAGKGFVVQRLIELGLIDESKYVHINADVLLEKIPQYISDRAVDLMAAAEKFHPVSRDLARQLLHEVTGQHKNVIFESTLRNVAYYKAAIKDIREKNHHAHITVIYIKTDSEKVLTRERARAASTGRYIPPSAIQKSLIETPRSVHSLSSLVDETLTVENSGLTPVIVRYTKAAGPTDSQLQISLQGEPRTFLDAVSDAGIESLNSGFPLAKFAFEKILYVGTFDPFHKTHLQEVKAAMLERPLAKVTIYPVLTAYYNKVKGGVPRARLIPYSSTLSMISREFANEPRVSVSSRLKKIERDVIATLIAELNQTQSKRNAILIGSDILKIWKDLPHFNELLDAATLIVGEDSNNVELTSSLKGQFLGSSSVRFIKVDNYGFRSSQAREALLSGNLDTMKRVLPQKEYGYLVEHPEALAIWVANFQAQFTKYVRNVIFQKQNLLYSKYNIAQKLTQKILQDESLVRALVALESGDPSTFKRGAHALAQQIGMTSEDTLTFEARLYNMFYSPDFQNSPPGNIFAMARRCFSQIYVRDEVLSIKQKKVAPFEIRETSGGPELWVKDGSSFRLMARLRRFRAGTPLYHWNDVKSEVWWREGAISAGDLLWRVVNRSNLLGGGLYVSLSSIDSANYGSHLSVINTTQDFLIAEQGDVDWSVLENRRLLQIAGIYGVMASDTFNDGRQWISLVHADAVKSVRAGTFDDLNRTASFDGDADAGAVNWLMADHFPLDFWLQYAVSHSDEEWPVTLPESSIVKKFLTSPAALNFKERAKLWQAVARYLEHPLFSNFTHGSKVSLALGHYFEKEMLDYFSQHRSHVVGNAAFWGLNETRWRDVTLALHQGADECTTDLAALAW